LQDRGGAIGLTFASGVAIGPGVQLDHLGAGLGRSADLGGVGLDEQRDPRPDRPQAGRGLGDTVGAAHDVQAAFGGDLFPTLGHQAGGVRPGQQGDADHLVGDRHLEVQRLAALAAQVGQQDDVGVADMAAILAQVGGDAVGAGRQGQFGRPHRFGIAGARARCGSWPRGRC
jgi:hypothetical protein